MALTLSPTAKPNSSPAPVMSEDSETISLLEDKRRIAREVKAIRERQRAEAATRAAAEKPAGSAAD